MLPLRASVSPSACAIVFLTIFTAQAQAQDARDQEFTKPPITITALQALPGPAPRAPCDLPPVSLFGATLAFLPLPDSSTIPLASGWRRIDPYAGDVASTDVRIAGPEATRVRIRRERNGARGRRLLMYRSGDFSEGDTCVLSRGRVGAIWTFYKPDPDVNDPLAYGAFGDVMTPAGRWYSVSLWAISPEERARAASTITELVMSPGNK